MYPRTVGGSDTSKTNNDTHDPHLHEYWIDRALDGTTTIHCDCGWDWHGTTTATGDAIDLASDHRDT